MFQDIKARIAEPGVGAIISLAAFDGSAKGVEREVEKYRSTDTLRFYGWVEGSTILGICGFEVHFDKLEIHLTAVDQAFHKQGIGRAMIMALQTQYRLPIEAETDDDALEFYCRCGFETMRFMHPKWGIRYTCVLPENGVRQVMERA